MSEAQKFGLELEQGLLSQPFVFLPSRTKMTVHHIMDSRGDGVFNAMNASSSKALRGDFMSTRFLFSRLVRLSLLTLTNALTPRIALTLTMMLGCTPNLIAETIYKSVDANGRTVYSDKPPSDGSVAERVEIGTANAYRGQAPSFNASPRSWDTDATTEHQGYAAVEILSPADDETIQSNEGNVQVFASVSPPLRSGDRLVAQLNGNDVNVPFDGAGQLTLRNVDRGTHSLTVSVLDANGIIQARGGPLTFHLRRFSALQPGAQNRRPPPAANPPNSTNPRTGINTQRGGGAAYNNGSGGASYRNNSGGARSDGGGAASDGGGARSDGAGIVAPPSVLRRRDGA